ncbi:hypothetical protein [Schaalia sp. JY-X169]|uniref:hypothetical protein n=1 Tax=Schaalia sp. JY-X169 TaxID=2758572 RepID=UPI0015F6BD31|nr:hypothetical protein [Schaalia sp. JY-X169]
MDSVIENNPITLGTMRAIVVCQHWFIIGKGQRSRSYPLLRQRIPPFASDFGQVTHAKLLSAHPGDAKTDEEDATSLPSWCVSMRVSTMLHPAE